MDIQQIIRKHKWIILIFFLALIVRIAFTHSMPVKLWDETVYINLGYDLSINPFDYSFANNGWSDFIPGGLYPKAGFRAPILPYLIAILYSLKLDFFIDILVPLMGALSIILLFILARDLFGEKIAIISSLLFTFIPLHVFYSARVLTDAFFTFFVILTFISFWKGYEKGESKHKILFGVFLALSLLSRYTTLWIIPIFLIYFLIRDKNLTFILDNKFWMGVLVFLIVLSPWFVYGMIEYSNPIGAFIHGMKASSYWGGIQPVTFFFSNWYAMFSVVGFIFIIALFYIIYKKEYLKKEVYLLLIWIVFFLSLAMYMPHKEDRFIIPIIPPIVILVGMMLANLKNYRKTFVLFIVLYLAYSSSMMFLSTYNTYHNINTKCFNEVYSYIEKINGTVRIVSENPPLFRYVIKSENAYYPDTISNQSIYELSHDEKTYFVFTRFNSGFDREKVDGLREILDEEYKLEFECYLDSELNFIYSN